MENVPCSVRKTIEAKVISLIPRSAKRTTRKAFARKAKAMLNAIPTSSRTGLGRISVVTLFSVRMYQCPTKLGIESIIEKGIMIPEKMGRVR